MMIGAIMVAKLSEKITDFFIHKQILKLEEKEVYCYCFELLIASLINLLIALTIGFGTLHFIETIVFLFVFMVARTFAGGYHADTHLRCMLIFVTVFSSFLLIVDCANYKQLNIILTVVGGIFLIFLPVADSVENRLSKKRKKKLKIKTILSVIIFAICSAICCIFDKNKIALSFSCPMFIIAISIIASYIKNILKKEKNYDKKN